MCNVCRACCIIYLVRACFQYCFLFLQINKIHGKIRTKQGFHEAAILRGQQLLSQIENVAVQKRGHWFSMVDLDVTLLVSAALSLECSRVQMRSSVPAEFMTTVESLWVPQQDCPFTQTSAQMFVD